MATARPARRARTAATLRRARRGAALAEAALLFPAAVAMVMGAGVATEMLLARLEVQEAARFGAWELASHQVADIAGGDPHGRFRAEARRVESEAARRYPLRAPFISGVGVALSIEEAHAGGSAPAAWRLSPDGRADAVARARVEGVALEERASVVVDSWNLPDGADVEVSSALSGLQLQVGRMKHQSRSVPDLRSVGLPRPDASGPFVVSRGYRPERRSACLGIPGYPASALGGLEDLGERLDAPQPRCFDTSPFRDTQEYAASLSAQMYRMRSAKEAAP
ncbi:MAG TPA: hypothetical protein VFA20_08220 [Myxococcaceae bacterium]|nr:hypothetical protein [Myxococcaceae bacterium]